MALQKTISAAPLRILHITASSMIGGGPEHVWQLVRHLPPDMESFIAAPTREPYGPRFEQAVGAQRVCALPQRKLSLIALWRLLLFIRRNNIDIIHSHGKGAGVYGRIAATLTRTPSVHTFHGIHLPSNTLKRHAYLTIERILCGVSRTCIAVSQGEAEEAQRWQLGTQKITVIPNGVEVPDTLPERSLPSPFSLVHVSRFDPVKNSLWLVELAQAMRTAGILQQCRFVLIGDGEELPELRKRIENAQLEEAFQIMGSQPSARPFFKNAGCLLSSSRREGLPLAVLEAQAEGVPAIVTDVIGNREAIVDGVTGFVFPLDDSQACTQHINTLLCNSGLWKQYRIASFTHAHKNFTISKAANIISSIYTNSIACTSVAPPQKYPL